MLSDNASTFLAAADELRQLFESDKIKESLQRQNVTWEFIPKRAPWHGGFWERLIGLTKSAIKITLGRSFVSLAELETIATEIEAMLNDRPLTYVSSDQSDPVTHHNHLLQSFWTRWKRDYLTSLREFHRKSGCKSQSTKIGDVVVVHDDQPRLMWKLAVVEDLIIGNDGLVQAAHIRTANHHRTSRPIVKLYPLEISAGEKDCLGDTSRRTSDSFPDVCASELTNLDAGLERCPAPRRAKRNAAERAEQRIADWAEILRRPPEDVAEL